MGLNIEKLKIPLHFVYNEFCMFCRPLHIAVARESQTMVSDFVQIMRQRGVPLDTYNNSKQVR